MKTTVEISRIQKASMAIEKAIRNWIAPAMMRLGKNTNHVEKWAGACRNPRYHQKTPKTGRRVTDV